jgi:two-component system osmolarity sensor histidine kinase EnvZ
MLAGISHDLRTPLTRMKLQLAMLKGQESVPALASDVAQMEHMVQEYLDFARGEGREPTRTVQLSALLKEIIYHYQRQGQEVPLTMSSDFDLPLRVHAFTRVLHNIIDNAIRYGYHARIRAGRYAGYAEIVIDDEGPGIPESQRELAFKAFTRLDPARNPSTGGAGLGLTIARDIVLSHGGEILLTDAPERGLRVIIRVPM